MGELVELVRFCATTVEEFKKDKTDSNAVKVALQNELAQARGQAQAMGQELNRVRELLRQRSNQADAVMAHDRAVTDELGRLKGVLNAMTAENNRLTEVNNTLVKNNESLINKK